jgi:hypothetical protein
MRKTRIQLTFVLFLVAAVIAPPVHATSLDSLIATNGTLSVGSLLFSNFATSPNVDATTVDVNVFASVVSGMLVSSIQGLRFSSIPAGSSFSATTAGGGGGGTRELVVDISFTVAATDPSLLIHSVSQSIDPATVANGNAIVRSLTGIPSGAPTLLLFSCIQGTGVPGGSLCPSPSDAAVLSANVAQLTVDRQIQIVVGQKFGTSADGNASSGFFDVAFAAVPSGCPAISVSPQTIPDATRQSAYSGATFTSSGGVGSVALALSGALPTGLVFDATTGTLTGTPQDHGIFTVIVTATDANGCRGSRSYTFLVRDERRRSARH